MIGTVKQTPSTPEQCTDLPTLPMTRRGTLAGCNCCCGSVHTGGSITGIMMLSGAGSLPVSHSAVFHSLIVVETTRCKILDKLLMPMRRVTHSGSGNRGQPSSLLAVRHTALLWDSSGNWARSVVLSKFQSSRHPRLSIVTELRSDQLTLLDTFPFFL